MRSVAFTLAALLLASSMQAAPEDAKDAATLKVVKVEKGKGDITVKVAIEWAKGAAQPKTDEITVVFLFQDKTAHRACNWTRRCSPNSAQTISWVSWRMGILGCYARPRTSRRRKLGRCSR